MVSGTHPRSVLAKAATAGTARGPGSDDHRLQPGSDSPQIAGVAADDGLPSPLRTDYDLSNGDAGCGGSCLASGPSSATASVPACRIGREEASRLAGLRTAAANAAAGIVIRMPRSAARACVFRGNPNTIPGRSRTAFRAEVEQHSGVKPNTIPGRSRTRIPG